MAKIKNQRSNILFKIENLKYAIEVEQSFQEQLKKEKIEKFENLKAKRELKRKQSLFNHELKAYGKEEYYKLEKEAKINKFLEKHELEVRREKQKYLRSLKKSKNSEFTTKTYEEKLTALANKKTKFIKETESIYQELIKNNPADASYEKVYLDLVNKANLDFENYLNNLNNKLDQKLDKSINRSNKRIAKLQLKLIDLESKLEGISEENKLLDSNVILKLDEVSMQFGGLKAVDNLSFEVMDKEIFGLIGPNGAGKTTVFNCITQFYKPTSGEIYFLDKFNTEVNLNKIKIHNVIKHGIVRTFQNVELIWELSVLDNLLVAGHSLYRSTIIDQILHTRKYKREEAVLRNKAEKILEYLNLEIYKDVVPLGLPYGILKRIELARTLMVDPKLIILDEPAAGLNEIETKELAETIKKIQKEFDCTIFLVEHDMSLVMDICDRVCAISFGKKLALGTPEEIQANKTVQQAYLGGE